LCMVIVPADDVVLVGQQRQLHRGPVADGA
jgi:hypothetical protein